MRASNEHGPAGKASAKDGESELRAGEEKEVLQFVACGGRGDGKSTLIDRILRESEQVFDDQQTPRKGDGGKVVANAGGIEFPLLTGGPQAAREQGIASDVTHRCFATPRRSFIVADISGQGRCTRNIVAGASAAELAVVVVDARKAAVSQSRRHSYIVSLLGIRHFVLAVNKMDLVEYDQGTFERIAAEYRTFAGKIGIESVTAIPVSALMGDNVRAHSDAMGWYAGPPLLSYLEDVEVDRAVTGRPFRMPVQWVDRPDGEFRSCGGTVASGRLRPGDAVVVLPANRTGRVARIATSDGDLDEAVAGRAVTVTLEDDIDIAVGDLFCAADAPADVTDQFQANLVWMSDTPLFPERQYVLKIGSQTVNAAVTELRHQVNVDTLEHVAAKTLARDGIAVCNLALDQPVAFDPYRDNRATGGFILIDRFSKETVGAGMIVFGLRRATNLTWQDLAIDKAARSGLKSQRPCILWFTGLSGSGKSTVANLVEKRLHAMGRHTYVLDGDNVRHGLNRDLGFTEADRVENIRRVAETAKLFVDAGVIVLVSFISPFRGERLMARELVADGEFIEVFVDAPLEVCEQRDPKGLYAKARAGAIKNFTGLDSPYEPPEKPEIHLHNDRSPAEDGAERIVAYLKERRIV